MANGYKKLADKPYESHYVFAETVIDYPVEKVWPQALNIGGWMSDHRLATVDGTAGQVGHFERVFPRGIGEEVPLPHYHLYGITSVIPLKCISLEVIPERGGSYGNTRARMGFDTILLTDIGGKTRLTFLVIDVNLGRTEPKEGESLPSPAGANDEKLHEMLERYFDNLKQRVGETG